ncbi:MAG: hypothetical protein UT43_C0043G0006 [Parcubacteria group bacterium GW2011_GWC1_39_29]|nr:MAG: hypothetical protein UT43_C0043G0006 [Parcubacteria group bacterium GW2011_GWC1_39_29]
MNSRNIPTTGQQRPKLGYDIAEYFTNWSQKSPISILYNSLVAFVAIVVLVGGIFFWASEFRLIFIGDGYTQNNSEIAKSGLETMKRMVGNQQVWSESIQDEYNKIFVNNSTNTQASGYIYNDNFTGLGESTDQASAKQ